MKKNNIIDPCWEMGEYVGMFCSKNGPKIPTLRQKGVSRLIGRKITSASPYLGSYGMGGPGFLGWCLEKKGRYPEEWLVLRLWAADQWLLVNGKWLDTGLDHFDPEKCLFPKHITMFSDRAKEIENLFKGLTIKSFTIGKSFFKMKLVGGLYLDVELPSDVTKLPPYGNGDPRKWFANERMEDALLVSKTMHINI